MIFSELPEDGIRVQQEAWILKIMLKQEVLWEALDRKNVSFYNFGEANETAHVT